MYVCVPVLVPLWYVCVASCVYKHACRWPQRLEDGVGIPENGAIGRGELPDMGAGTLV